MRAQPAGREGRGRSLTLAGAVAVVRVATKTVDKTIAVGAKPNGIVFRAR